MLLKKYFYESLFIFFVVFKLLNWTFLALGQVNAPNQQYYLPVNARRRQYGCFSPILHG